MFKLNISSNAIFILAISITFYSVKFTQFSPIYIIYLIVLFIASGKLLSSKKISLTTDMLIVSILLLYILLTQMENIFSGEVINLSIALMAYLYIRAMKNQKTISFMLKTFLYMIWVSIVTLSFDSVYRITHPGLPDMKNVEYAANSETLWIYIYKYNTIMFSDSNSTGLIALVLFFSILSVQRYYQHNSFKYAKLFLSLLLLFSISRASWIAFILGIILEYVLRKKNFTKLIYINIGLVLMIGVSFYFFQHFESDGSLDSKFAILSKVYDSIESSNYSQLFFGSGFRASVENLGIYTHLLLLTYFYETGIIGLLIFLTFLTYFIYIYNSIVLFPVMLVSLSFFLYVGTPFLFVPLAFIANIADYNRKISKRKNNIV